MNPTRTLKSLCAIAASFGIASLAMAQENPMVPKPTAEHKVLAADEGTWDATVKSFFAGPQEEPMVSKGTETNRLLTGGLWIVSKFEGDIGGMKFEGSGQFGYDPIKKKYVGTWIDSMSPNLSLLEGSYDSKTKTMTYVGDGVDPTGKMKFSQRMVTTYKAEGTRAFTLYMTVAKEAGEVKVMEITYTKRK
jgi:Protein of unknown function (DUF1579)